VEAVDLLASEWASDINTVASALKLWLRELPEPLLTHSLYGGFIEAASTISQMQNAKQTLTIFSGRD